MIVVVASAYDARARDIVARWGHQGATMLTAEDLSKGGWSHTSHGGVPATVVVCGQPMPQARISEILTLRPCVFAEELEHIARDDRDYVAAEMNAFLLAWLSAQSCPVMNRPTASCLAGPNWRPAQWTHAAAGLGIPFQCVWRHVPDLPQVDVCERTVDVITVGDECFSSYDLTFNPWAIALARAAGTDLLCSRFSLDRGCFLTAHPWPKLTDPAVFAAVRDRLERRI